jgi:hypothetical protein
MNRNNTQGHKHIEEIQPGRLDLDLDLSWPGCAAWDGSQYHTAQDTGLVDFQAEWTSRSGHHRAGDGPRSPPGEPGHVTALRAERDLLLSMIAQQLSNESVRFIHEARWSEIDPRAPHLWVLDRNGSPQAPE